MSEDIMRNRFITLGLGAFFLGSTTAYTTTPNTATFNTAVLNNDAAAIAYAVQAIESLPDLESHLSATDKTKFDNLVAQIKSVTAQVAANSNGSITVAAGKD